MGDEVIQIKWLPELKHGVLIAGFDGWGNALDVSKGMVSFLIRKLKAEFFATINCDLFYRFDETRPFVRIEQGLLKSVHPPSASFHVVRSDLHESDLVILKATEPHLQWYRFVDELCSFCEKLNIKKIITLGSMYDNVLHSDKIISGIASTHELIEDINELM